MRLRDLAKLVEQFSTGGGGSFSPGKTVNRPNPDTLRGGAGGPTLITPLAPTRPNLVVAHIAVVNASSGDDGLVDFILDQLEDEADPGGSNVYVDHGQGTDVGSHDISLTGIVPVGVGYWIVDSANTGAPTMVLQSLHETPL
jgi:hypothetical protein